MDGGLTVKIQIIDMGNETGKSLMVSIESDRWITLARNDNRAIGVKYGFIGPQWISSTPLENDFYFWMAGNLVWSLLKTVSISEGLYSTKSINGCLKSLQLENRLGWTYRKLGLITMDKNPTKYVKFSIWIEPK